MSYRIGITILAVLCFSVLLIGTAYHAYSEACLYEREAEKLTDRLHTAPKVISLLKYLAEQFSFGNYGGYSEEIRQLNAIIAAMKKHKHDANTATLIFWGISGIFLLFAYVSDRKFFVAAMWLLSLITLVTGLFAPILMITTYKDIPIIGHVVFFFQSKGVITTIKTLFGSGNILVAIPLFLFSVVVPFLKSLLTGIALLGSDQSPAMVLIKRIGKWAMADVFVVALLLTYFTLNRDKSTTAEIQTGFYFFLGYVIFSMLAANLTVHPAYERKPKLTDDTDIWGRKGIKETDPFREYDEDPFR
jgi:hypothetical protein